MSTYKEIKGFKVQTLASDTAASVVATGTWASGGSMNTARDYVAGWAEDSDACLIAGGSTNATELYNGTSWTEKNDMSAPGNPMYARHPVGTTTAALAAGGGSPYQSTVEQWDGTNWTEVGDLVTATSFGSNSPVGTTTAGLIAGGLISGGVFSAINQVWNGSSWSDQNELNEGRAYCAGLGTTTAALEIGGQPSGPTFGNKVEQWDGSSWTEISEFNTSRSRGTAGGTTTSALFYAGATASSTANANTEFWNGSSWTEIADLSTARMRGGGGGSLTSAILAGGNANPPVTAATEEWTTTPAPTFQQINLGQVYYNSGSNAFKVTEQPVPGGSWASGGAMNTARRGQRGSGSKTAGLVFGGGSPPPLVLTESYDGTAFTEVADLNTGKSNGASFGTQASTITTNEANVELWNGSSWTETTEVNTDREAYAGATGPTSAGIIFGGVAPPYVTNTETWNGTSWTEVNDLNNARAAGGGAGLNSGDAICILGDSNPYSSAYVETWDGTNWTEVTQANTGRYYNGASGVSSSSAITYGGITTVAVANTESWNGTAWTEIADLATARFTGGAGNIGSSSTSAYYAGGGFPDKTNMEEFTAPVINTTITVS